MQPVTVVLAVSVDVDLPDDLDTQDPQNETTIEGLAVDNIGNAHRSIVQAVYPRA